MFYITSALGLERPYNAKSFRSGRRLIVRDDPVGSPAKAAGVGQSEKSPEVADASAAYERAAGQRREREPALTADQIMTSPVRTVSPKTPLREAWFLIRQHRFRHLPVVNAEHRVVGLISDRDLLPLRITDDNRQLARDVMQSDIVTARAKTEIRDIARVMFEARIGAMPIVDDAGRLIGIVTRSDILRTVVNRAPFALWV